MESIIIPVVPPGTPLQRRRLDQHDAGSFMDLDPRRFRVASYWVAAVMGFALAIYVFSGLTVTSGSTVDAVLFGGISAWRAVGETFNQSAALNAPLQACQTAECQHRLHELQTKVILEDKIYQAMYQSELKRTKGFPKNTYDRNEIIELRLNEIREQAERTDGEKRYLPEPAWMNKSHPEICIVGNPKTGTSHLYNIISRHRDVQKIQGDKKEHCSNAIGASEHGLHSWHEHYYEQYDEGRPRVNGCISKDQVELQFVYSPPSPQAKFFILLRDPAEWTWAAYNFWANEAWEEVVVRGAWVNDRVHYRSPEVFHELILSGGKLKGFECLTALRANSVQTIRRLLALVGKENLIILKNEDLQPSQIELPGGILDRISEATTLAKDGFDEAILHLRSNCNAHKGIRASCTEESHTSGGYPITHNRPMLEATRRFIYLQWHAECKVWAEEFGIVYPECLAAIANDDSEFVPTA